MRIFIAFEIPQSLIDNMTKFIRQCEMIQDHGIRYVSSQNLHITLKFCGELDQQQVDGIISGLKDQDDRVNKIRLTGTGGFPTLERASVIWMGIEHDSTLISLYNAIEDVCFAHGIQRDERGFKAHLTLGRVKGKINPELVRFLKNHDHTGFGEFIPASFRLIQSRLTPDGAVYTPLAQFDIIR